MVTLVVLQLADHSGLLGSRITAAAPPLFTFCADRRPDSRS